MEVSDEDDRYAESRRVTSVHALHKLPMRYAAEMQVEMDKGWVFYRIDGDSFVFHAKHSVTGETEIYSYPGGRQHSYLDLMDAYEQWQAKLNAKK